MNPHPSALAPTTLPDRRLQRLQHELGYALAQTRRSDLLAWGTDSGKTLAAAATRRVKNVVQLLYSGACFVGGEASTGWRAWQRGELAGHAQRRASRAVETARDGYAQISDFAGRMAQALKDKPQDTGVHLLTLVLTSLLVSGGPDGDGGAPDLDLMFGIDAHRSILSHSILMGAALEAGLLSVAGSGAVGLPATARAARPAVGQHSQPGCQYHPGCESRGQHWHGLSPAGRWPSATSALPRSAGHSADRGAPDGVCGERRW